MLLKVGLFTIRIGWLTVIGWQATFASAMYLNGNMVQALIILTRSDYVPHPWRKALYAWGLSVLSAIINIVGGKFLPRFEGTILIFHVLGFFAILVPLTYMADHKSSAEEVFTYFINEGNWPSKALSVFVGLTGPVFAFAGGDAAVHVGQLWPCHGNRCANIPIIDGRRDDQCNNRCALVLDVNSVNQWLHGIWNDDRLILLSRGHPNCA